MRNYSMTSYNRPNKNKRSYKVPGPFDPIPVNKNGYITIFGSAKTYIELSNGVHRRIDDKTLDMLITELKIIKDDADELVYRLNGAIELKRGDEFDCYFKWYVDGLSIKNRKLYLTTDPKNK